MTMRRLRRRHSNPPDAGNALTSEEVEEVLELLRPEGFRDLAPAQLWAGDLLPTPAVDHDRLLLLGAAYVLAGRHLGP